MYQTLFFTTFIFPELPITSTRRRSKLPILLETPELSQIDNKENEAIIESPRKLLETPESSQLDNIENVAIIELIPSPENEISFKNTTPVIKMAPATSAQDVPAQVESGIKDTPKRVTKTNTPKSIKKSSSAKSVTTPKSTKIPNVAAKKSGVRSNPWPSKVVISPIKKAALQRAFAGQVINLKKTPPHTLKKKLNANMKLNRYKEIILSKLYILKGFYTFIFFQPVVCISWDSSSNRSNACIETKFEKKN